jgi:hypothetical protein
MVCRLSTLFTLLHYLVGFVPTNQYQIPRVRPLQEPLHIDHARKNVTSFSFGERSVSLKDFERSLWA